jgi:Domain of unknown function DUF11/Sortilin, neurotensin receptor 3,
MTMHIRLLIIAAALWLGASTEVRGAINGWTAIGPAGGTVNKIVFNKSTPATVYAVATGGFYRSLDGGTTWQLIASNFMNAPRDVELDPSDPTRVYVVAPNYPSLYVSTDSGATLSAVTSVPTAAANTLQLAISQSGTTLYMNSGAQIFCSTDRGNTWTQRTAVSTFSAAQVWKMAIDPTDSNTLYATATMSASAEGTFVTHDGAMTWQPVAAAGVVQDFAFNGSQVWTARFDGVWYSNDKGATWTEATTSGASAIAIDPSNPAIIYAGSPNGSVYRTPDAGVTWTDVTGNNTAGQTATIEVDPGQSAHLLVGGLNGIAGTTTSGTQWSAQAAGLNSTSILGLSADPAADRIYINVSSGGVYYSAAGAASTTPVNNFGSGGLLQLSSALPTLNVSAILAQPGLLSASLVNGLARSTDGGTTWSLVPLAPSSSSQQVSSFGSWPANPQTIVAATATTLYRSTDAGSLWAADVTGLPANAIVSNLVTAASDPSTAYAFVYAVATPGPGPDTYYGIYKSTDAGLTWAPAISGLASSQFDSMTVDPTNANVLYAATESGLLKSLDGAATWNPLTWDAGANGGYPDSVAIDPKHPSILYASRWFIARSADGGVTWQILRATSALPVWSPSMLLDPNRPENLLVSTLGSGVQQFTVAPDLALTVAAPPSPIAVGVATAFNYTVSNLGPFDATGVTVSVQLPAAAQGITASASGGTCTISGSLATCVFGVLAVGSSNAIAVSATSPAAGPFQLVASVLGDQPDPNPANNTVTTAESVANLADLSVTVTGTVSALVGAAVSYTVVVANAGPDVAAASQLKFQLGQGLTPGSASGATCTSGASGLITCALGDLAAAKSVTVTVPATAAAAGTQVSTATVSSTATDPVASNNTAMGTTVVTAPPPPSKGGGGSLTFTYLLMLTFILIIQKQVLRRALLRCFPSFSYLARGCSPGR